MVKATDTKERILDRAEALLQDRGYNGFSYKHIAELLDIKNAAVHYHYPSKADLGTAMVHRFRERLQQWIDHVEIKYADKPLKLFDGFITVPRSYVKSSELICPLGVLESNFNILPTSMQQETRYLSRDLRAWLSRILDQGRQTGDFHFTGDATDKALLISAALQGASIMACTETPALFENTVKQIKRDLGISNHVNSNQDNSSPN